MMNDSIVPGSIINGRRLIRPVREDGYNKWFYDCTNHPDKEFPRPMRLKDMQKKKPVCCFLANRVGRNSPTWKGYEDIPRKLINQIKRGAAERGLSYELSDEYLWKIWQEQEGKCAYTGWPLILGYDASLDRIRSNENYVEGNVEWTHAMVNMAKQSLAKADFIKMCRDVALNRLPLVWSQDDPTKKYYG